MKKFSDDLTSDQKRLARAEHWGLARKLLRARDVAHHKPWRTMILAGMSPEWEMGCIRELMPKAHITAVDCDVEAVVIARSKGADEAVLCNLNHYVEAPTYNLHPQPALPPELSTLVQQSGGFDAIHLDFCSGANELNRDAVRGTRFAMAPDGVMIVTFSYGRDVLEFFESRAHKMACLPQHSIQYEHWQRLAATKLAPTMCARIEYVLGEKFTKYAKSIIIYQGNQMPMCSVLCFASKEKRTRNSGKPPISVLELEKNDLELAVCSPDLAKLYGLPEERIAAIRRSFAAKQAVHTAKIRKEMQTSLMLT